MMTDGGYDNPRAIASVLQNGKINTTSVGKHDILSWDDIKDLLSRMDPLHEIQRLLNNYGVLGIEDLKKILSIENEYGENILHDASNNNQPDILNIFREPLYDNHCPDILQAEDKNGHTPLIISAYRGYLLCVKALVCSGRLEQTQLEVACQFADAFGHKDVVEFLRTIAKNHFVCMDNKCIKSYASADALELHEQVHTGTKCYSADRPFICTFQQCEKTFKTKANLTQHNKCHSEDKPFICTFQQCEKTFKTKVNLTQHNKCHSEDKPFICTFQECGKTFKRKYEVDRHLKQHSEDEPFICTFQQCEKKFKTKDNLTQHNKCHTKDRPFICTFQQCKKTFKTQKDLTQHNKRHNEDKPFICTFQQCKKTFKTKEDLTQHNKRHTEYKPFTCTFQQCGKKFKTKDEVNQHNKCHIKYKPFICTFQQCKKTFKTQKGLNQHNKRHSIDRPVTCIVQGKG
ncbi:C2H2-type zinc finger protein [Cardinium endosymbiont of Sogatella furcifera]|uniref:C2H2-type zinc finger protein n=1 Tax=Cardinium endosymbiont of Sogatella furcifera TaxID=650378 RepID=UPI0013B42F49|nr:C2H2-type zinc finger protein [Cardinium endosymbiont of Sogatella furcifera]